jgi:hypothetical protein
VVVLGRRSLGSRRTIQISVAVHDLAEIDRRAQRARISRTEYMVRCGLGQSPDPEAVPQRLDALEKRIERLEALTYGEDDDG